MDSAPAVGAAPAVAALPTAFPTSFADVAEAANPAVVSIEVASRTRRRAATARPPNEPFGFRRPETPRRGTGTGFLIDAAGHLLTNQHVIEGAERVTVKLTDGRSFRARVVGADPDTDVAVLKVEAGVRAAARAARRFRPAARRRVGLRHRQPVGLRAHGHGRRRELRRAQALRPEPRPLHPDRRRDQLRQQRRAAAQHRRRRRRHQLGGQPPGQQHRLLDSDQSGQGHPAAVAGVGACRSRLSRRRAARRRCRRAAGARAGRRRRGPGPGRDAGLAGRARRAQALRPHHRHRRPRRRRRRPGDPRRRAQRAGPGSAPRLRARRPPPDRDRAAGRTAGARRARRHAGGARIGAQCATSGRPSSA